MASCSRNTSSDDGSDRTRRRRLRSRLRERQQARLGQLANHRHRRRARGERRDELGDLVLGSSRGFREQLLVILRSQVRREQPQPSEMDATAAHCFDDCRQLARGPRDEDPVVGGALRKTELASAEGEHRGVRALEVEPALVDLAQMHEKIGLDQARSTREIESRREKRTVAQRRGVVHARNGSIATFDRHRRALVRAFALEDSSARPRARLRQWQRNGAAARFSARSTFVNSRRREKLSRGNSNLSRDKFALTCRLTRASAMHRLTHVWCASKRVRYGLLHGVRDDRQRLERASA